VTWNVVCLLYLRDWKGLVLLILLVILPLSLKFLPLSVLLLHWSYFTTVPHLRSKSIVFSEAKRNIICLHHQSVVECRDALLPLLSPSLHRSILLATEKGSSSWLTTFPLFEHGFSLHKGAFWDSLCLHYGWRPPLLPSSCVCGRQFSLEHAFGYPGGGLPTIRHNELRILLHNS